MNIGRYEILDKIGQGGMGDVFLVRDPVCGRDVALKKMRDKWSDNKRMQGRFMREAKIAAQLSHPSIIPIFSIADEGSFYTMPCVEGQTLKEILRITKAEEKEGEALHPIGSSVPALVRIFLTICGAMAYSHDRGVLHRDLKPENVIIGKYGEVIILDWGLANFIDKPEQGGFDFELETASQLTQPGKIPGTLLYMSPERALGAPSTIGTDIYSLGVMLYQLLTLHFPFQRNSIKEFRKIHQHERILDPEEVAPDRDISPHLSHIALKCLSKAPEERYQSVEEIITDLERYIEGLPEWRYAAELSIENKEDWQFQENIPLTRHRALTRGIERMEWINLMISKSNFPGNLKIETTLILHQDFRGLGLLFCIPEENLQKGMDESFCLWVENGIRLFRSGVEVAHHPDIALEIHKPYELRIEWVDNHVHFYLDGELKFGFLSHIPLPGSRVGIMRRDDRFSLSPLQVAVGSQNILVNCLAIPDAFLARHDYDEALQEYRKISHSFPGRAEGREATFRAGLTLLQKAGKIRTKKTREMLYTQARTEFEKLHGTPGAPLEFLGKALVYKAQGENSDEVRCLELALRKFPKHPLKPIIVETILSRLYETSQSERAPAFRFALIVLRHLPHLSDTKTIANILEEHLEPLPFFTPSKKRELHLTLQLAFWLGNPLVPYELLEKGLEGADAQNAQVALILLDCLDLADLSVLENRSPQIEYTRFFHALLTKAPLPTSLTQPDLLLWKALLEKDTPKVEQLLRDLDPEAIDRERDLHFFLCGCAKGFLEGETAAKQYLSRFSEKASPPLPTLLSHYLAGRIQLEKGWIETAFDWEKKQLFLQLSLYASCIGDAALQKALSKMP